MPAANRRPPNWGAVWRQRRAEPAAIGSLAWSPPCCVPRQRSHRVRPPVGLDRHRGKCRAAG